MRRLAPGGMHLVCCLWIGVMPAAAQQLLDRVVARVNGQVITLTDVNAAIGVGIVSSAPGAPPAARQAGAVVQLIDRQLMLAEVARFAPPEPPPEEVDAEVRRLRAAAGDRLSALMEATGLDEARMRDLARDTLRIQRYLDDRFGVMPVADEEVERYYREHAADFTRDGILQSFEDAAPEARRRASAERREATVAEWVRDLRRRAQIEQRFLPTSAPASE